MISGIRASVVYKISKIAFDPRWSNRDKQKFLAWCSTAQHLGWNEGRAIRVAEALVFESKLHGIVWPDQSGLYEDMACIKDYLSLGNNMSPSSTT